MRWTNVENGLPPRTNDVFGHSEEVLCQAADGYTTIGYVRYCPRELRTVLDGESEHVWTQSGRDMYTLLDIVRWIYLDDILDELRT